MPSRSKKQRRYLYHRFGAAWVKKHHFNRVVKSRAGRRKGSRKRRR